MFKVAAERSPKPLLGAVLKRDGVIKARGDRRGSNSLYTFSEG
jgi:hypothetical protein